MTDLTRDQLLDLCTPAATVVLDAILGNWDTACARWEMSEPLVIAHFLANVAVETAGMITMEEGLNYSASQLLREWPKHFTETSAQQYAAHPRSIANYIYGYVFKAKLGNENPQDGWTYRGRGLLQLTGRDEFKRIGELCGLDLVGHPELAESQERALDVAFAFWKSKNISAAARRDDTAAVVELVSGSLQSLAERAKYLAHAKIILGIAKKPEPVSEPLELIGAELTPPVDKPAEISDPVAQPPKQPTLEEFGTIPLPLFEKVIDLMHLHVSALQPHATVPKGAPPMPTPIPAAPAPKGPLMNIQLSGVQKILIGLFVAVLPTVINYVSGINWTTIGVSAQTASMISTAVVMVLHMIPRPPAQ